MDEIIKKSTYTPAMKKAIDKYRNKNIEKYNEMQREYYSGAKQNEEWRIKFNERCKANNKKYREKKRLNNPPKTRGRPRKIKSIPQVSITTITLF
jgi:hypothetical protein